MSPRGSGNVLAPSMVTRPASGSAAPGEIVVYGTWMTKPAITTTTSSADTTIAIFPQRGTIGRFGCSGGGPAGCDGSGGSVATSLFTLTSTPHLHPLPADSQQKSSAAYEGATTWPLPNRVPCPLLLLRRGASTCCRPDQHADLCGRWRRSVSSWPSAQRPPHASRPPRA